MSFIHIFVIVVAASTITRILVGWIGVTGVHWGAKDSEHPGWWWVTTKTKYVRPIRLRKRLP